MFFLYGCGTVFWDPKRDPNLQNYPYCFNRELEIYFWIGFKMHCKD